ncbi:hypothetical protein FGSG_04860 [Fusarium graminearum PH-1]|uniref:hypothetical protein n=1 Tax=Gibberella zeae (strain ATCC MYA-4620 / CBS 123657 / FGSC 9075 / NRRL 31084 / PH-1) TaxID=229533 RepID=UPI000023D7E7|nr:hypothetical protein FGSG_04860 [Fusarium graminearum PH-1]ESU10749.1 hypothetical protein FGSG_04860 [Fusarium graminearum PH-1]|eukprot:XP_011323325.1 hypothetical protein FGSG_04860 [Fusarium graminearum PH-1]
MSSDPYLNIVKHRTRYNPCIGGLDVFLQQKPVRASRIISIDCPNHGQRTSQSRAVAVQEDDMVTTLKTIPSNIMRIVLIEDINSRLMSLVGNTLDIDPLFFADYVNTSFKEFEVSPPPPSIAILPSLLSESGYLHLHYQQIVDLGDASLFRNTPYASKTHTNITRNVRRLPPLSGKQLALVRSACSLLVKKVGAASVCLVLVDSPAHTAVNTSRPQSATVLHGGFEDVATSRVSLQTSGGHDVWKRDSMLQSLVHYLQHTRPLRDTTTPISMLDLVYYPIRITLAHWNSYIHLISRYSKHYEYSLQDISTRLYSSDITDLQRWRRRIRQSRHKLTLLTEFFATSMVQLLDSRQSIVEAVSVRRLTYLALTFAPLAWVASLFSMSEPYLPGHNGFWVYFATAIPLLCVVFLLSTFKYDHMCQRLADYWKRIMNRYRAKRNRQQDNALKP